MIRDCNAADFDTILAIINDGAQAYQGVIPEDRRASYWAICRRTSSS